MFDNLPLFPIWVWYYMCVEQTSISQLGFNFVSFMPSGPAMTAFICALSDIGWQCSISVFHP